MNEAFFAADGAITHGSAGELGTNSEPHSPAVTRARVQRVSRRVRRHQSPSPEMLQSSAADSPLGLGKGSPFGPSRRTIIVVRVALSSLSRATTVITLMPGCNSVSIANFSLVGSAALRFDW